MLPIRGFNLIHEGDHVLVKSESALVSMTHHTRFVA